jgi:hypothetical protein
MAETRELTWEEYDRAQYLLEADPDFPPEWATEAVEQTVPRSRAAFEGLRILNKSKDPETLLALMECFEGARRLPASADDWPTIDHPTLRLSKMREAIHNLTRCLRTLRDLADELRAQKEGKRGG